MQMAFDSLSKLIYNNYVKGPHPHTSLWASYGENLTGLGGGPVFLINSSRI